TASFQRRVSPWTVSEQGRPVQRHPAPGGHLLPGARAVYDAGEVTRLRPAGGAVHERSILVRVAVLSVADRGGRRGGRPAAEGQFPAGGPRGGRRSGVRL